MCGIFAWAGKNPKKFNRSHFNILGIYNQARGVHSCGVAIDGDIKVGIGSLKLYKDFISSDEAQPTPETVPTVIGHTRQASNGAHTIDNAHPFGFGSSDYGFKFIGVHNGTLVNYRDFADDFGVKLTESTKNGNNTNVRAKIDSEILLESIYRSKNFKVLSKYVGGAAIVFQDVSKPNVVYCFHGESKVTPNAAAAKEERPLFYYKETKNSLYISSIQDSLKAIANGATDKIGTFDCNVVYKITDGDFDSAELIQINRSKMYQKENYYSNAYKATHKKEYGFARNNNFKKKENGIGSVSNINKEGNIFNIHAEERRHSPKVIGRRPYFNKLRWSRNGHLISGIYTFIPHYGFHFLDVRQEGAEASFNRYRGKKFNAEFGTFGTYELDDFSKVPFSIDSEANFKYFYQGIMLKNHLDYAVCMQREKDGKPFGWTQLSHMAAHPIVKYNTYKRHTDQKVLWNGEPHTGWFATMGSHRTYNFRCGNLIGMKDTEPNKNFYFFKDVKPNTQIELPLVIPKANTLLLSMNNPNGCACGDGSCINCSAEDSNSIVMDTIDKVFEGPLTALPLAKRELEKHLPNSTADKAIKAINSFMDSALDLN